MAYHVRLARHRPPASAALDDRHRYSGVDGRRLVLTEGLRPSDSPTRALARRCAGALRSRGSLAVLARSHLGMTVGFMRQLVVLTEGLRPSDSPTRALARRCVVRLRSPRPEHRRRAPARSARVARSLCSLPPWIDRRVYETDSGVPIVGARRRVTAFNSGWRVRARRSRCCASMKSETWRGASREAARSAPLGTPAHLSLADLAGQAWDCYYLVFGLPSARARDMSPSSRGPGRGPFKAKTRVRIPLGTPTPVSQSDQRTTGHSPLGRQNRRPAALAGV